MNKKKSFKIIDVKEAGRGRWETIFQAFSIELPRKNKQSPCPACGGTNRFRYDDQKGYGDYFCNQCGAGDGLSLIEKCTGMKLSKVIDEVAAIVGLSDTSNITDADRARWRHEAELREKQRLEEVARIQENIAAKSRRQWAAKYGDTASPYLERKQVKNFNCKVKSNGDLIVPAMDAAGKIWNIQTIPAFADKYFNPEEGGRVKGCFFLIGAVELLPADQVICIAEGYATAASIHMATGYPVAVAFTANNLPAVGEAIRDLYPSALLLYCADDDSAKEDTGWKYANKALAVTGGIAVKPVFELSPEHQAQLDSDKQPQASTLTDFNDLHIAHGLDAVRDQVNAAIDSCPVPAPFPAPLSTANSQNQGQGSGNEQIADTVKYDLSIVGGEGASKMGGSGGGLPAKLTEALTRYAFISTTNDVFDYQNNRKFKLNSLKNELGKHYQAWLNSDDRKSIEPTEAEQLLILHAGTQSPNMSKNCVLLRGEAAIYDLSLNRVISPQAAQMDYPKEYKNWLENPARLVVPYENLRFDPTRKIDIDPEYINTFRGYPVQALKDDQGNFAEHDEVYEQCRAIVAMITSLCNGDLELVNWLLKWLAYPLQHEGAKLHSAVLMASHVQGSGKSTLFEKVMGGIYGNYHKVLTSQQLENTHHNEWIENVSFLFGEEIATNSNKYNITPYLNAIITAKEVGVNPKHRSAKQVPAHFNMAFASNATVPFPLEGEARRWLVIAPEHKLDSELAQAVHEEIAGSGIQAFYTYLLSMPLADFEHDKPPHTDAKQALIESSKASVDFFFEQWASGQTKYKYCTCQTEQLYTAYKIWAGEDLEHKFSKRRFVTEARKHNQLFDIRDKQHWRKSNHESGQSQLFVVNDCPPNEIPIVWFGKQIVLFDESMVGGVPHAKYVA